MNKNLPTMVKEVQAIEETMLSNSLKAAQCKSYADQFKRDFKCGLFSEVSVNNRNYLSKFQSSNFEEFIARAYFKDNDKKLLLSIFDEGKKAIETFDQMMNQSLDAT
jgi:hypothetical protein